jgi:Putative MetA-pathway of phenol degradation
MLVINLRLLTVPSTPDEMYCVACLHFQSHGCRLLGLLLIFTARKRWMMLPLKKTPITIVVATFVTLFPVTVRAQAPRDYLNTPVNAAALFLDFINSNTETASQSDLPLPNNVAVGRLGFASILWSFPLRNKYGGVGVTGGYTSVKLTGPLGNIKNTGFSDPSVTLHANIFGGPALRKDQFAQAIPTSFSSFHFTVNAPLGSYDRNSLVNTGANRWAFNPLLNLSITPDKGVSWIDLYAGGRFYTNNNAYQGNNKLSQDPLGTLSLHYSHNIGKRMFAGFGVNYDNGGETYVNNIPQHNAANGFRPGVLISRARTIWKYRLTLKYELTGTTPHAAPTNSLFQIRLSGPLF